MAMSSPEILAFVTQAVASISMQLVTATTVLLTAQLAIVMETGITSHQVNVADVFQPTHRPVNSYRSIMLLLVMGMVGIYLVLATSGLLIFPLDRTHSTTILKETIHTSKGNKCHQTFATTCGPITGYGNGMAGRSKESQHFTTDATIAITAGGSTFTSLTVHTHVLA